MRSFYSIRSAANCIRKPYQFFLKTHIIDFTFYYPQIEHRQPVVVGHLRAVNQRQPEFSGYTAQDKQTRPETQSTLAHE